MLQAAVKSKKATDTYKLYVEKYALAKADFEQKMTETAQVGIFKALNLQKDINVYWLNIIFLLQFLTFLNVKMHNLNVLIMLF